MLIKGTVSQEYFRASQPWRCALGEGWGGPLILLNTKDTIVFTMGGSIFLSQSSASSSLLVSFTFCNFCYSLTVVTSLDPCLQTLSFCVCSLKVCMGWMLWDLWECRVYCLSYLVPLVLSRLGSPPEARWGHSPSSQPPAFPPNSWPSWPTAGLRLLLHLSPPSSPTSSPGPWNQPTCSL